MTEVPIKKKPGTGSQGFSDELANQINKQQAAKVHRKMNSRHIKSPKV
jgi:hypothetical protein